MKKNENAAEKHSQEKWQLISFHRKYEKFTKKLRKIMWQYQALPVVLSLPSGIYKGKLECDVAYVYDSSSGEFMEKVIIIHVEEESQMIDNNDVSLPF